MRCEILFYKKANRRGYVSTPAVALFCWQLYVVLLFSVLIVDCRPVFALDFNGRWDYSLAGGGERETTERLEQRYYLTQSFQMAPTQFISSQMSFNYQRLDRGTESGYSEILQPFGDINWGNEFFSADLRGSISRRQTQSGDSDDLYSWETTLQNEPFGKYWPSLNLNHFESGTKSERSDSEGTDKNVQTGSTAEIFWGLDNLKLLGRMEQTTSESSGFSPVEETVIQYGGEYRKRKAFWEGRLRVRLLQTAAFENREISFLDPTKEVIQEQDLPSVKVLDEGAGIPPVLKSDLDIAPSQRGHLVVTDIFSPSGEQQVNRLHIAVLDPEGLLDSGSFGQGAIPLQWDIYASSSVFIDDIFLDDTAGDPSAVIDESNWTLVAGAVFVSYDSIGRRFEIDIPELDTQFRHLRIVVTNLLNESQVDPTEPDKSILKVRDIVANRIFSGAEGSASANFFKYTTNLGLNHSITRKLSFSSNVKLRDEDDISSRLVTGGLSWRYSPRVIPSLRFSQNVVITDDGISRSTQTTRRYGCNLRLLPLPRLFANLYAGQNQSYIDSRRTSTTTTYRLNSSARLYPDLNANLSSGYVIDERFRVNGDTLEKKTMSGTLSLRATLLPSVTAFLDNRYSETTGFSSGKTSSSHLDLRYRPSSALSMTLAFDTFWAGSGSDALATTVNLALIRTRKTRLDVLWLHRDEGIAEPSEIFNLRFNWDFSRIFTLKSNAVYNLERSEPDRWSVNTTLYMRL